MLDAFVVCDFDEQPRAHHCGQLLFILHDPNMWTYSLCSFSFLVVIFLDCPAWRHPKYTSIIGADSDGLPERALLVPLLTWTAGSAIGPFLHTFPGLTRNLQFTVSVRGSFGSGTRVQCYDQCLFTGYIHECAKCAHRLRRWRRWRLCCGATSCENESGDTQCYLESGFQLFGVVRTHCRGLAPISDTQCCCRAAFDGPAKYRLEMGSGHRSRCRRISLSDILGQQSRAS